MQPVRVIYPHDLYEYLEAYKSAAGKQKHSRSAQGIVDFCNEAIAHFGLTAGAKLTVIRDE